MSRARAVCKCVVHGGKRGGGETWMSRSRRLLSSQKFPLYSLSLCLLVHAQLLQHTRHRAARAQAGFQQRGSRLGVGVLDSDGLLDDVTYELCPQGVGSRALHVGSLHGGGTQGRRPLLQYNGLPQPMAHQYSPIPHLLIEPLREALVSRLPLMGSGRAGPKVGRCFGLRSTKEARGV